MHLNREVGVFRDEKDQKQQDMFNQSPLYFVGNTTDSNSNSGSHSPSSSTMNSRSFNDSINGYSGDDKNNTNTSYQSNNNNNSNGSGAFLRISTCNDSNGRTAHNNISNSSNDNHSNSVDEQLVNILTEMYLEEAKRIGGTPAKV